MKKPFPSTRVTLSFSEKTISVNNGYIESYRNEKTIAANIGYIDLIVMKKTYAMQTKHFLSYSYEHFC